MFEESTPRRSYPAGRANALGWGVIAAIGVLLIALGVFAMGYAFTTGVVSMVFFGGLIFVAGIAEMVGAFRFRGPGRSIAAPFLAGLLSTIVGALVVAQPIAGLAAAGALIGAYYLTSGLFRGITSLVDRYAHWGWDLLYGVVATLLGAYVLMTWPISALWLVGTLIGIELVFRGVAWIGAGLAVRKIRNVSRDVVTRSV